MGSEKIIFQADVQGDSQLLSSKENEVCLRKPGIVIVSASCNFLELETPLHHNTGTVFFLRREYS